jgi:hypothetical protein
MSAESAFIVSSTIDDCFNQIEQYLRGHGECLEAVITELHYLLNKFDPIAKSQTGTKYRLVPEDFDDNAVLKKIIDTAKMGDLKIPQIRFKADEMSMAKNIPLPSSTRKNREPLLHWFHVHWSQLVDDIARWKDQDSPGTAGN